MRPVCNVIPREENLCHGLAHPLEQVIPQSHQLALSNGRQSLHLREMFRTSRKAHGTEGCSDGTGRDNDHFVAILPQGDGSLDDEGEDGEERLVGFLVDYGGCSWWGVSGVGGCAKVFVCVQIELYPA